MVYSSAYEDRPNKFAEMQRDARRTSRMRDAIQTSARKIDGYYQTMDFLRKNEMVINMSTVITIEEHNKLMRILEELIETIKRMQVAYEDNYFLKKTYEKLRNGKNIYAIIRIKKRCCPYKKRWRIDFFTSLAT